MHLSKSYFFHSKLKHLALDYFFIREKVSKGQLYVYHIPTQYQPVDALTKPRSKDRFLYFQSKIGVLDGFIILWYDIERKSGFDSVAPDL